jgi:integrase
MTSGDGQVSIADAADRWISAETFSAAVRDAVRSDLRAVAQVLADHLDRPAGTREPPVYIHALRRLEWRDLDPILLSRAIAEYGLEHAPASHRRIVATWSSFLEWLRDGGYPVATPEPVRLPQPEIQVVHDPGKIGRLVGAAISGGRRSRDAWPERDRAMVGVIVAASLSLANVSLLLLRDVTRERDRMWLRSRSRRGSERVVELPPEVRAALEAYLAAREASRLPTSAPDLFVRAGSGKAYTAESLRYLYVGWFKRACLAVPRDAPAAALRPVYAEIIQELDEGHGSQPS